MEIKSWINHGLFILLTALLSLAANAEPSNLTTFGKDGKVPFSDVKLDTDGNGQVDSWVVSNSQTVLNAHFEKGKIDHFIFRSSIDKKNYLVGYFNIKTNRLFVWQSARRTIGLGAETKDILAQQPVGNCESKPVSEVIEDLASATGVMQGSGNLVVSCFTKPEVNKSMSVFANDGLEAIRGCADADDVMNELKSGLGEDLPTVSAAYANTLKSLDSNSGDEALFECAPTQVGKKAEFVENGGFFKIRLNSRHNWHSKKPIAPIFVHEYFHAIVNTARNMKSCKAESVEQVSSSCLHPQTEKAKKAEEELVSKLTEICLDKSHNFIPDSVAESVAQAEPQKPVPPPLEVLSPPPMPQEINQVSNHTYLPAEQVMAREMPRSYAALAESRAQPLFDWVERASKQVEKQVKGNWQALPNADADELDGGYKAPRLQKSSGPVVAKLGGGQGGEGNERAAVNGQTRAGRSEQELSSEARAMNAEKTNDKNLGKRAGGSGSRGGNGALKVAKAGQAGRSGGATGSTGDASTDQSEDENSRASDRSPSSIDPEVMTSKAVENLLSSADGAKVLKTLFKDNDPKKPNRAFMKQLEKMKYSIRDIDGNHFGVIEAKAKQCFVLRAIDEPPVNVNCIAKKK